MEVTRPDLRKVIVPLERLTRLNDGLEQLEDVWGDELSEGHSEDGFADDNTREYQVQTEDGSWLEYEGGDEDEWVEEDEDEVMTELEMDGEPMDTDDEVSVDDPNGTVPGAWPSGEEEDVGGTVLLAPSTLEHAPTTLNPPVVTDDTAEIQQKASNDELPTSSWKRFDILPSAPPDHAFFGTPSGQPSRQFLARLSKEYRALSSSLPDSVIVRTYEDRTDLLRSLIIGPENTPYEDAPFVIDWMLDANFPQTPPVAHFLSWTNGE